MIPNKSHLQVIVRELERFNSELEKSYNFQEFFDRCRAIFTPKQQTELNSLLKDFKQINIIDSLEAQSILYATRVKGLGGSKSLRIYKEDGSIEKLSLNLNKLERGLRNIKVWCHKQIIKLIKEQDVKFDRMERNDIK